MAGKRAKAVRQGNRGRESANAAPGKPGAAFGG